MLGNINLVNKVLAKQLNLPENVIESVNDFYFSVLENEMKESTELNFFLKNLGTVSVSYKKIRGEIHQTLHLLRAVKNKEYKNPEKKKQIIEINEQYFRKLWIIYKKALAVRNDRINKISKKMKDKQLQNAVEETD